MPVSSVLAPPLVDLSRPFLPESLAGLATLRVLDDEGRRMLNQIRGVSYLHLFDLFETCLADGARAHAMKDIDARDTLVPLLRLDSFDHNELFRGFARAFEERFPVHLSLVVRPHDLDEILQDAAPLSLLILALHLKLVTQQHYLASVRGDESLDPAFVSLLKEHWALECGRDRGKGQPAGEGPSSRRVPSVDTSGCSPTAIQQALGRALPGRIPAALRDYRRIVFRSDDVLRRQSELDVATFEAASGAALEPADREVVLAAQVAAHRKTFITVGIVNAAFVYAIRSLGPTAPAMLAGMVATLSTRA